MNKFITIIISVFVFASVAFSDNVKLGNNTLNNSDCILDSIAIGDNAMARSRYCASTVAIGQRELFGEGFLNDTTSINDKQIFVSSPLNAFCINPNKEIIISNTPLYYLDGTLHLNADRVLVDKGYGIEGNNYFKRTKEPVRTWTEYPHLEYSYGLQTTNVNVRYVEQFGAGSYIVTFEHWFTGKSCKVEFNGIDDGSSFTSARLSYVFDMKTEMTRPNGSKDTTICSNQTIYVELPLYGNSFDDVYDTVRSWNGGSSKIDVNRRLSRTNQSYLEMNLKGYNDLQPTNTMFQTINLRMPTLDEAFFRNVACYSRVDEIPTYTNNSSLVSSAGVAEYSASKVEMENVDARFSDVQTPYINLNLKIGTTNILRRMRLKLNSAGVERIVSEQEKGSDGYYVMTETTGYTIEDLLALHGSGQPKYVNFSLDGNSYHDYEYSTILDLYINWAINISKTTSEGNVTHTISWDIDVWNAEETEFITNIVGSASIVNPKFKLAHGASYPVDSKASKGCLASAKSVYDSTFPIRYSDTNPNSYSIGTMELVSYRYTEKYTFPFGYYGRIDTRATSVEDTFVKDGLVYPKVAYICFSNRTSELITGWHYNEFAITNGTTRTVPVSFYAGAITNINLTISYHTSPSVGITMNSSDFLWYGRTYKYSYSDNAPYFTTRFGTSVMDSSVSRSCVSSTKYVDNRLGGMTFKFENGSFNVYSNGVVIGTLSFTPSP